MKIKLIIGLLVAVACFALPSFAEITPEQVIDGNYMYNSGYSETMVDMVNFSKATTKNEKYVSNRDKDLNKHGPVVRFFHRVFSYLDPAQDEGTFLDHDIKMYPTPDDL